MTSHRSSTSSSDPTSSSELRRYLRALGGALAVVVACLVTITATGYRLGFVEAANRDIYDYQRAKLDATHLIKIAFVGDSSLGNAIDAAVFTALARRTTVNLALNGSYGSGGAYNMVRKLFDRGTPQLVVVMLSIDTMRRDEAFPGFYFSAEPAQLLTTSPVRMLELYFSLKTAKRVVEQLWKSGVALAPTRFDGDYIAQADHPMRHSPAEEVETNPLLPNMVAQSQLAYIERIATLCHERGVDCVYAHGPIFDGYCVQAVEYVAKLNEGIRAAGLDIVAGTPTCIEAKDVGDSIDHVRSDLKRTFTTRYFELLRADVGPPDAAP